MAHHEPLKSLCPVDWSDVSADLAKPLPPIFASAQTVVDSIPAPQPPKRATTGRARSQTDPPLPDLSKLSLPSPPGCSPNPEHAAKLRKEWNEVSLGKTPNPNNISVYKLSAKDGKGAWFARRSLHTDISFDKFRAGLEREFAEALKAKHVGAQKGTGKVRGILAEKRVERIDVRDGETALGRAEVYLLSAQFPMTATREFVTLLLSHGHETAEGKDGPKGKSKRRSRAPRQFMLVSKPCKHDDCPQRSGFIRGQYESVEVIREVPLDNPQPLRRTRSSIDLSSPVSAKPGPGEDFTREAILRAANKVAEDRAASASKHGRRNRKAVSVSFDVMSEAGLDGQEEGKEEVEEEEEEEEDVPEMAIEWLMVTRSDPGGSVPRFMVERGTPNGIVTDAKAFLDWLNSKSIDDLQEPKDEAAKEDAPEESVDDRAVNMRVGGSVDERLPENGSEATLKADSAGEDSHSRTPGKYPDEEAFSPSSSIPIGFYGRIAGALGVLSAASSVVTSRIPALPSFAGSAAATDSDPDLDDASALHSTVSSDDSSSIHSFLSALEGDDPEPDRDAKDLSSLHSITSGAPSALSDESRALSNLTATPLNNASHDKELKKLEERRRKAQEKIAKMQERIGARAAASAEKSSSASTSSGGKDQKEKDKEREREEAVLAKLRAKHEREVARQEEKYQRELKRLEAKRVHEEKRAAERRRKTLEREARANAATELEAARAERDAARAERDVANRQIDLLKDQVGELQAQNTKLVAILGKHGLLPGLKGEGWERLKKTMSAADVEGMVKGKGSEETSMVGSDKTA